MDSQAHAYNPWRQRPGRSKPAWASSSEDPNLKKTTQKRVERVTQGVGPEFKLKYHKKKKKKKEI
jgi:hypothetical protein